MIYGGWDPNTEVENGDDMMFGDSYLLDTKTWSWRTGPKPRYEGASSSTNGGPERVGHSAVLAPGGKHGVQVLVFGGRVQHSISTRTSCSKKWYSSSQLPTSNSSTRTWLSLNRISWRKSSSNISS